MTEHQDHKPARVWRRAAARLVDTCAMAVMEAVVIIATFMIAAFVAQPDFFDDENWENFYVLWVLLMVPASIPVYWYEVVFTARSGQTFGKRLADIRVVPWDGEAAVIGDQDPLEFWRFGSRWAIPHGAGIVAAVVAATVVLPGVQYQGDFGWPIVGAAVVPWALVYSSSLWDKNGRGWHDKAAGTIVVKEPEPQPRPVLPKQAGGSGSGACGGVSPQGTREAYGLVSDYYAPRRPPRHEADEQEPT